MIKRCSICRKMKFIWNLYQYYFQHKKEIKIGFLCSKCDDKYCIGHHKYFPNLKLYNLSDDIKNHMRTVGVQER